MNNIKFVKKERILAHSDVNLKANNQVVLNVEYSYNIQKTQILLVHPKCDIHSCRSFTILKVISNIFLLLFAIVFKSYKEIVGRAINLIRDLPRKKQRTNAKNEGKKD